MEELWTPTPAKDYSATIMAKLRVEVLDRGYTEIMRKILSVDGYHMTVGVHYEAGFHKGLKGYHNRNRWLTDIAWANEYGDAKHYLRPFMATSFEKTYAQDPTFLADDFLSSKTRPDQWIATIGNIYVDAIRDTISNNNFAPNEERYVKRMKPHIGNKPLLLTGSLRKSINKKITKTKFNLNKSFTKNRALMLRTGMWNFIPKAANLL